LNGGLEDGTEKTVMRPKGFIPGKENPPLPRGELKHGGLKSPFEKGGFRGI
jgi:hypothetical protein